MATVTFSGKVSAQAQESETVTIKVTKPDDSEDLLTATTQADGSFSASKEYLPGDYIAVASVEEDALYQATTSGQVLFSIEKQTRSITLDVSIA